MMRPRPRLMVLPLTAAYRQAGALAHLDQRAVVHADEGRRALGGTDLLALATGVAGGERDALLAVIR